MDNLNILFVCTGNSCRSPMAAAIFTDMVSRESQLQSKRIEVRSAGTLPAAGRGATEEAIEVIRERGLDISWHRSQQIDRDLLDWADVILVMEGKHVNNLGRSYPQAFNKTHLLTEFAGESGDVPDPIGYGIEVYRECAGELDTLLSAVLEKIR